ncbi:hypothetical protein [Fimbriimonas ginsengisoli]|nr:hypothetical protein [Fimbriimonas ginsengisoli]
MAGIASGITVVAKWDGKNFVPTQPVHLKKGTEVRIDLPGDDLSGREQLEKMFSLFESLPKVDLTDAAFDRGLNNDRE